MQVNNTSLTIITKYTGLYIHTFVLVVWTLMILAFLFLLMIIFPENAEAYLDPGGGSYLFQLMLGVLFGVSVSLKVFWKQVKAWGVKIIRIFQKK